MNNDLDARVAALMQSVEAYAIEYFKDYSTERTAKRRLIAEQAIRAELQKPALHDPVTDAEIEEFIRVKREFAHVPVTAYRRALESFLQGRAKPAQNNLAGLLATLYYGQYSTNEDKKSLDRNIELALKDYDIGAGKFVESAQEEITDAERYQYVRDNMAHIRHLDKITMSNHEFDSAVNQAIRASKGEKT